jgi:hypothetical protein
MNPRNNRVFFCHALLRLLFQKKTKPVRNFAVYYRFPSVIEDWLHCKAFLFRDGEKTIWSKGVLGSAKKRLGGTLALNLEPKRLGKEEAFSNDASSFLGKNLGNPSLS